MKKLLHISFTFFLAVVLVIMGSGVTFLHCSCSGKTTVILSHTAQNGGNSDHQRMHEGNKRTAIAYDANAANRFRLSCLPAFDGDYS